MSGYEGSFEGWVRSEEGHHVRATLFSRIQCLKQKNPLIFWKKEA